MYEVSNGQGYAAPKHMPAQTLAQAAPPPIRNGVTDAIGRLSVDVDGLLNVVAGLEERLQQVLQPSPPDVNAKPDQPYSVQLVGAVADVNGRVNLAVRRLHDILSRIDI